jgi:hypothetical protein
MLFSTKKVFINSSESRLARDLLLKGLDGIVRVRCRALRIRVEVEVEDSVIPAREYRGVRFWMAVLGKLLGLREVWISCPKERRTRRSWLPLGKEALAVLVGIRGAVENICAGGGLETLETFRLEPVSLTDLIALRFGGGVVYGDSSVSRPLIWRRIRTLKMGAYDPVSCLREKGQ